MKSKMLLIILLLVGIIFIISGYVQQSPKKEYVCPDGSIVTDPKLCPKETATEPTITQPTTYCGDGRCQSDESCSSCPQDCGACEAPGKLIFSSVEGNYFWYVHAAEGYPEFIQRISSNEFNVFIKTLKSESYKPVVNFIFRISNIGDKKIENIESTITCDQILPTKQNYVITDSVKNFNGVVFDWYFWCQACPGYCSCDTFPKGKKVTYLYGCTSMSGGICPTDSITGEKIGPSIDRWLEFNVDGVTSDFTLSCNINVFAEKPSQTVSKTLIIHFLANR